MTGPTLTNVNDFRAILIGAWITLFIIAGRNAPERIEVPSRDQGVKSQ